MQIVEYIENIGGGAFAKVWLAKDDIGRKVAVKFFDDEPNSYNAFNSANRLGIVNHQNVIMLYSFEDKQKNPTTGTFQNALVMEYCESAKTLREILDVKISENNAFKIGIQLIDAIEAIHNCNLGHYDLHDENVLVLPSSDIKVIDLTEKQIDAEFIEWEQSDDLIHLVNRLTDLLNATNQSDRVLSKLYKYKAQEKKNIRDIRKLFVKELNCSVNGCNAPAIVEVFLYDMYPYDEFEFLQDDFTCPYLCDAHWAENEEKARSPIHEKTKIGNKTWRIPIWSEKPVKGARSAVKYPYTKQQGGTGYTKYKTIGKPHYYSGKPKPSYY
jgi:serine/threonine protein kinase